MDGSTSHRVLLVTPPLGSVRGAGEGVAISEW